MQRHIPVHKEYKAFQMNLEGFFDGTITLRNVCCFWEVDSLRLKQEGGKDMDLEKTGELLSRLRKECGMTQKQVAEKLQISDRTVSKWERGVSHS